MTIQESVLESGVGQIKRSLDFDAYLGTTSSSNISTIIYLPRKSMYLA